MPICGLNDDYHCLFIKWEQRGPASYHELCDILADRICGLKYMST